MIETLLSITPLSLPFLLHFLPSFRAPRLKILLSISLYSHFPIYFYLSLSKHPDFTLLLSQSSLIPGDFASPSSLHPFLPHSVPYTYTLVQNLRIPTISLTHSLPSSPYHPYPNSSRPCLGLQETSTGEGRGPGSHQR